MQQLSSIYGVFLRKLALAFQQLMFDGVCHLFENVEEFVSIEPVFELSDDDHHNGLNSNDKAGSKKVVDVEEDVRMESSDNHTRVIDPCQNRVLQDLVLVNAFDTLNPVTAEKYVYDLIQKLECKVNKAIQFAPSSVYQPYEYILTCFSTRLYLYSMS
mgnify:CR=1 FL=1